MVNLNLHAVKARTDLTNEKIAWRMSQILNEKISEDSVQRYFTGQSGIPIERISALLEALNLKIVEQAEICVPPQELDALRVLARKALSGLEGKYPE